LGTFTGRDSVTLAEKLIDRVRGLQGLAAEFDAALTEVPEGADKRFFSRRLNRMRRSLFALERLFQAENGALAEYGDGDGSHDV
jgi:hypothetical protein